MSLDERIENAKVAYRRIAADPHLAARVAARAGARRPAPAWTWLPAGLAAAALVVAVVALQRQPMPTGDAERRLALTLPSTPGSLRTPRGVRVTLPNLTRTRGLPVVPATPSRDKAPPRDHKNKTRTDTA